MIRILIVGAVASLALVVPASAQDKPSAPSPVVAAPPSSAAPPQKAEAPVLVAPEEREFVLSLQRRADGLAEARGVLQKELDATVAEFSRQLQRLQTAHPGYDLKPDLSGYVKKPAAEAVSKIP
jgi:hypothetical protein